MKTLLIATTLVFNFSLFGQELQSTSRELKTEIETNSSEEMTETREGLQSKAPIENRKKKNGQETPIIEETKKPLVNTKKIKN
jgi:hypothetical protein